MATRSNSSSSILVIILLIFTFPIWFGVGAALFGVIAGLFGAIIGIIGAIFGVLIAAITLPFRLVFGWHDWDFGFDWSPITWIVLLIIAALLVRRSNK
ncbi:MAG: hypothetical protein KA713_15735 [Chryseotalea sp. WA131a]|jgi:hypothetical protein|nr:MAG: hypothetical protein KA713_15735 [Chryseotalea sp. WA131a]